SGTSRTSVSTPRHGWRSWAWGWGSRPGRGKSGRSTSDTSNHRSAKAAHAVATARRTMQMGLEFLARVRTTSIWLAGVVALMTATYVTPLRGLALAAGALWSLVNLQLIERLVLGLLTPAPRSPA